MFKRFNFSLWFNGFPMKKAKEEFEKVLQIPETKYQQHIESKKWEIFQYHVQHNSFYKKLLQGKKIEHWEDIPVLTKSDLQQPLQNRLSVHFKRNIYINKTSGSSGHPFIFAKDKFAHALTWYSNIYRFGWFGIDFNHSYQARFYGIPLNTLDYWKERLKDFLLKRYRFIIFDLSDHRLEKIVQHFKKKKFDYINGYTSSIVLFAKYLEEKNIVLKNICPTLKVCMVTSEMLFDEDKSLLEKQFGIPIVNEYGASELDLIAFQNVHGEWQLNTETLLVEIVNEKNQVVENGKEGKIVITSFYNKANPFIRYEIGDIGIIDERSTSKKSLLKKLIGRTNDVAFLANGKKIPGLTFYYVTKSIIEDTGNVKEFIIKQLSLSDFEIEYVASSFFDDVQKKQINLALEKYVGNNLQVIFTKKDILQRSHRGKLKQFISLL